MSLARTAPLRLTDPCVQLTVGTSQVQGSDRPCHGVLIKALCSGQQIYVKPFSSTTILATNAWRMDDLEVLDLQVKNLNELAFIASAAAQTIVAMPYSLY